MNHRAVREVTYTDWTDRVYKAFDYKFLTKLRLINNFSQELSLGSKEFSSIHGHVKVLLTIIAFPIKWAVAWCGSCHVALNCAGIELLVSCWLDGEIWTILMETPYVSFKTTPDKQLNAQVPSKLSHQANAFSLGML